MNMDTNKINDLAKILRQNQLTKLDLTEGDTRIVLEAGGRQAVVEMPVVSVENIAEVPVAEVPSVEKQKHPQAWSRNPRWWVRFILRHRQGQSPLCRWAIR